MNACCRRILYSSLSHYTVHVSVSGLTPNGKLWKIDANYAGNKINILAFAPDYWALHPTTGLCTRLLGFAPDYWALHTTTGHFPKSCFFFKYYSFSQVLNSMFDPNGRNAPLPSPEHFKSGVTPVRHQGTRTPTAIMSKACNRNRRTPV